MRGTVELLPFRISLLKHLVARLSSFTNENSQRQGTKQPMRSCSIGINRFRLIGLVELFRVLLAKNRLWLVWLLNFFNPHQTGLKWFKMHW